MPSVLITDSASKNEVLAKIRELNPTEEVIEVSFAGVVPDTTGFVGLLRMPTQYQLSTVLVNIRHPFKKLEEVENIINGIFASVV